MTACHAEMCLNWTGQGCACLVMDIEPDLGEQPEDDDEGTIDGE